MPLGIRILFEGAVIRRYDFFMEPYCGKVCVKSRIRHNADDNIGVLSFDGAA